MAAPSITVLMPVYNSEAYLAEAIDSILAQTFIDFEFLIINDGSTDASREIALSYCDKRIVHIDNNIRLGLAKSLNKGIDLARGKYIARMDADDISIPDRLQKQFDYMEDNPAVDICGSWYACFGNKTSVLKTPVHHRDIRDTLFFRCCLGHPSVSFRKKTLERYAIKYSESFRCAQDYELWCRELNRFTFYNIPEILLQHRVHDQQIRTKERIEQDAAANAVRKRNCNSLGVTLSDNDLVLFGEIVSGKISCEGKDTLVRAARLLDTLGKHGEKIYGETFIKTLRKYLCRCAESGIVFKQTSLPLFFRIFCRWGVYPTFRSKMRYLYHWAKNMIFCIGRAAKA